MSRRRKEKDLRIRVIGVADFSQPPLSSTSSASASASGSPSPLSPSQSATRGSVVTLTLNELIESDFTDEYDRVEQPLWIQVENAHPKEIQRIGEHFGLHPLTIEGIQTRHTREKLEIFQNYLFLVFHSLHGGSNGGGGGFHETREKHFHHHREGGHTPGTFAATSLVDPFDVTRAQAAELAGRSTIDANEHDYTHSNSSSRSSRLQAELMHEGSRLMTGQDKTTARYYGGVTQLHSASDSESQNFMPAASPLPPRRHKTSMSISRSNSNLGTNQQQQQQQQAGLGQSPSPQPSPHRNQSAGGQLLAALNSESTRERPPIIATHADRFQLPYPMGMGPDVSTPAQSSSESGSSAASDTSQSDEDESSPTSPKHPIMALSPRSDAAVAHTRPKSPPAPLTPQPAISAQVVAALARESEPLRTSPIKLVVFPHLVLSFHSSHLDTVNAVRYRLQRVYSDSVESTAWIIHALLDSITDSLLPVVNATAVEVDALEELIYVLSGSEHRDLLKRMGMTRRRLSFLRQRLWSKRDILMSLIGKDWQLFLGGVQIPYLRDVYDHVVTMLHKVEAASDLLVALQNTYLANVQIDVAEASNDANNVMKNLTAIGAIIMPMQLVASLWGMNSIVPWGFYADKHVDWQDNLPFLSICLGMLLVTVVTMVYFRRANIM